MDNKQIEEAKLVLSKVKENMSVSPMILEHLKILLSLAQLFLSVKGAPEKKEFTDLENPNAMDYSKGYYLGYNLCHDEFTAWLAERMEGIEESIEQVLLNKIKLINDNEQSYYGYPAELIKNLATAIKTMILEEEN